MSSQRGRDQAMRYALEARLVVVERDAYRTALEEIASGKFGIKPKRFADTVLSQNRDELRQIMARGIAAN